MIIQDGILPLNFEPELGDRYETTTSRAQGVVIQKVRNPQGSVRLALLTSTLTIRWTTWTRS
jgi:hypothetical protein